MATVHTPGFVGALLPAQLYSWPLRFPDRLVCCSCDHPPVTSGPDPELATALPEVAREVEEFVAGADWDQPPQLFALVPTAHLLAAEPGVSGRVDASAPLTPVAQEPLPDGELDVALAGIMWPSAVAGCAAAVHVLVLPPGAEAELDAQLASPNSPDSELLRRLAAEHPHRREARLVAAVLRDGAGACVLRLRGDEDLPDEIIEHPDLAPNLLDALRATFEP
jgi:hypothetical protein